MKKLSGETAIISGGLGDIGRAIALCLAESGARIAIGDVLPASAAQSFLRSIQSKGQKACYDRVDVSDAFAVQRWINTVSHRLGTPTLIIPNAAIVTVAFLRKMSPSQWERELQINLTGACYVARAGALRLIKQKKAGRIVFIGSWAAHFPHPNLPAYCVSKAGLRMLCQCMAVEFAADNILVNEIAPGYVDAGLSGRFFRKNPKLRRQSIRQVPVKKLISPEEVARQVLHLCDPENQHMTGSTVLMDGGLSLVGKERAT